MARTYAAQMQDIANKYQESGEPWPTTAKIIAAWAMHHKLWAPHPSRLVDLCADELARAMREEYITDPQGRRVRANHVARIKRNGEQLNLWEDIRTANREHMEIAFQQRRQQIVGDCRQLKADVDSFNDNRKPEQPIQMIFDFTLDIEESEAVAA
jgi:hypothetical protein